MKGSRWVQPRGVSSFSAASLAGTFSGLVLASSLALAASACARRTQGDAVERAQTAQVSFAIDQLRNAPNSNKQLLLKTLRQVPCSVEAACALKRVCLEAYTTYIESLNQTAAVRVALRTSSEPTATTKPQAILEDLLNAESKLRASRAALTHCEQSQSSAKLRYGF